MVVSVLLSDRMHERNRSASRERRFKDLGMRDVTALVHQGGVGKYRQRRSCEGSKRAVMGGIDKGCDGRDR